MDTLSNKESLRFIVPEAVLALTVLVAMALGVLSSRRKSAYVAGIVGLCIAIFTALLPFPEKAAFAFRGHFVADGMTAVFRFVFFGCALFTLVFAYLSKEIDERDASDVVVLVLSSTIGMSFMAGASDMVTMYIAMEFVGILSYVLAGLKRESRLSSEAALKYVIFGAAASGVALFGLSYLFGIAGDTSLVAVREVLQKEKGFGPIALLAIVMVFAGLFYKTALAPMHMWCPDVYQGAPTPITAFFSVGPKAAGFALLLRFCVLTLEGTNVAMLSKGLMLVLGIVSMVSMTLGNLAAFNQRSVKRLLAYSSIAHAGYMAMGVTTLPAIMGSSADFVGFRAIFLYLVVYLFMNLGAFFVVSLVVSKMESDDITQFTALGQREPFSASVLGLFLFSLAGIPPTAGFIGKFYLFYAVIAQHEAFYYVLAFVGILNSFISLFYYARILKVMFLDKSADYTEVRFPVMTVFVLLLLAIPTLLFGIYFSPLLEASAKVLG